VMGGGLWGLGYVIVDMRVRKLLKRLLATPMRRSDFLLALITARTFMLLPEILILALVGRYGFGVPVRGSVAVVALVIVFGAFAFSGIGLFLARCPGKGLSVVGFL